MSDDGGAMATAKKPTARARQAAETRKRIVKAAVQIFSEQTYDDVAVSDIAKAAGVAHGLLFHYFGSKRGIYLEAMRGAAEQLEIAFVFKPDLAPVEQIRHAVKSHLQYLATHRGLALRLILGGRGADPVAWEVFEAARWRAVEATAALFGVDPRRPAVRMAGRAAVSAMDEAAIFWLDNDEPFPLDDMVDWMVRLTASIVREAMRLDPTIGVEGALDEIDGSLSTT
ncbi:TetR/AcrR family transcriptional regulator [Mycobacterium sp. ITM-2016-00316]|uniref:TetR/AcrR family transcriptional regulator n=1 Tax=Mycobacterium sp. ITM-2016-00316 TaxID=2099695 RepID=UPI000CF916BC|nr:TetR/AcrR family transcriptional regulator [Mycobacterium sp. ITM-2016-00316]WNG81087.1 TetR/AcrR family transcriptional regulator [Mycobacterium sp. ITM-2016-00316]